MPHFARVAMRPRQHAPIDDGAGANACPDLQEHEGAAAGLTGGGSGEVVGEDVGSVAAALSASGTGTRAARD